MFPKVFSEESDWLYQFLSFNFLIQFYGIVMYDGTAKRDHRQAEEYIITQNPAMLFDSSKKGKMCSNKPTAQKLIWS